jgi:DNA-binding phage protein
MAYCGYSGTQVAEKLRMNVRTFYRRMETPGNWSLGELLNLNRILGLDEPLAQCFGLKHIN